MERRMRGNSHVRCGAGEKMEIISNSYLSPSLGGTRGQCTDIQITAKNIQKTKERLYKMLAEASGQPYDKIEADCERDYYMSAEETVAYGLADVVLSKK